MVPALELPDGFRPVVDRDRDLPAEQIVHRRRAALVGDRDDVDLGEIFQKLAGEMGRGAVARHAVGKASRLGAAPRPAARPGSCKEKSARTTGCSASFIV